ncbi:MAG: phosphate ABC transporter permease PstA [Bacteroidales bacterium]|nr:phosphate ABC transporter permease PstA [Bacteroidales bacterium]HOK98497.1 phosphate ABC transporter permease PstA [Bacteroidales bacterium]HPO64423.1 phosphate ABC transporter permease PstA [Bacteroidales bacterium]
MKYNLTKKIYDRTFQVIGLITISIALLMLVIFLVSIFKMGIPRLSWDFITSLPSRFPEKAGIYTAMMGTIWLMVLTAIFAIPIGVMGAIYLEEYGKKNRFSHLLEKNIANLSGVPSVIYGILGLELFARTLALGNSLLTGSLTLSLLILPVIIVSTREALKAIPNSLREGSYALGATKWQTIYRLILPAAAGNILTGIILALSRAIGEAAPLIVAGALVYVPFAPTNPMDEYSALPIQIFNWISRPQAAFAINAAAGIIVLLVVTFLLNGFAIAYRYRLKKKQKW